MSVFPLTLNVEGNTQNRNAEAKPSDRFEGIKPAARGKKGLHQRRSKQKQRQISKKLR